MAQGIPAATAGTRRRAREADRLRHAGPAELHAALTAGRERLLALFEGFERALGTDGLHIAFDPVLNLPLWELGHIGWFEEHWLARNPGRGKGVGCDPALPRSASVLPGADARYDSSKVPHARRWALDLPTPEATRAYLRQVREQTSRLLRDSPASEGALYFFRLVLFHEAMHAEAWHFMAQQLGIDLGTAMCGRAPAVSEAQGEWAVPAGRRQIGSGPTGFSFDNELAASEQLVDAFAIDRAPVTWARFLPFIETGAYARDTCWSPAGWSWRARDGRLHPRHLRRVPGGWQQQRFGLWVPLDLAAPALHLSLHEAEAWCHWAGRRLPTEIEWETAALRADAENQCFDWGEVWEWTASPFSPYAGFTPHPYRDYSEPWFDGRPVLRGASFATAPHLKHPRYRNFFPADRDDVFAGFRSAV